MEINDETLNEFYQIGWEKIWLNQLNADFEPIDTQYKFRMLATMDLIDKPFESKINILDTGCGVGIYDINIVKRFNNAKITAIDISKPQISLAKQLAQKAGFEKKIDFKAADLRNFKIDKKFDYIICTEVLEHLIDPREGLDNINSLCRKDTKIIISVPQLYDGGLDGIIYRQIIDDKGNFIESDRLDVLKANEKIYSFYHELYSYESIKELLNEYDFIIERFIGVNFKYFKSFPRRIIHKMRKLDSLFNVCTRNKFASHLVLRCRKKI